jgi:hypothetical protein
MTNKTMTWTGMAGAVAIGTALGLASASKDAKACSEPGICTGDSCTMSCWTDTGWVCSSCSDNSCEMLAGPCLNY